MFHTCLEGGGGCSDRPDPTAKKNLSGNTIDKKQGFKKLELKLLDPRYVLPGRKTFLSHRAAYFATTTDPWSMEI